MHTLLIQIESIQKNISPEHFIEILLFTSTSLDMQASSLVLYATNEVRLIGCQICETVILEPELFNSLCLITALLL